MWHDECWASPAEVASRATCDAMCFALERGTLRGDDHHYQRHKSTSAPALVKVQLRQNPVSDVALRLDGRVEIVEGIGVVSVGGVHVEYSVFCQ